MLYSGRTHTFHASWSLNCLSMTNSKHPGAFSDGGMSPASVTISSHGQHCTRRQAVWSKAVCLFPDTLLEVNSWLSTYYNLLKVIPSLLIKLNGLESSSLATCAVSPRSWMFVKTLWLPGLRSKPLLLSNIIFCGRNGVKFYTNPLPCVPYAAIEGLLTTRCDLHLPDRSYAFISSPYPPRRGPESFLTFCD